MTKKKQVGRGESSPKSTSYMDFEGQKMDIRSIMKDIDSSLVPSYLTWKEKKELENRKVVSLGGKPPKKQRLPLSVARVPMKKQKEREQKMLQENLILGRFGGKRGGATKKTAEKRKPEDKVLRPTEGHFRNGVLDVKRLLRPTAQRDRGPRESDTNTFPGGEGKKKKGGKKKQGKKKGGGKRRH